MTNGEYVLWEMSRQVLGRQQPRSPCLDCTPDWEAEMRDINRCDRPPFLVGRPRKGRHSERTRAVWRENARAYRARKREAA
jgi:hypothetical protein